jgi:hypothetical protein
MLAVNVMVWQQVLVLVTWIVMEIVLERLMKMDVVIV